MVDLPQLLAGANIEECQREKHRSKQQHGQILHRVTRILRRELASTGFKIQSDRAQYANFELNLLISIGEIS
jgi:hypothetical protein